MDAWAERQASMRRAELSSTMIYVTEALEEVALDDLLHAGGYRGEKRRAVVFYLDRGTSGFASLLWWIQAWEFIGLNDKEEGFDIVIMAHPEAVPNIPTKCSEIGKDFVPSYGEAGQCIYKPYIGKKLVGILKCEKSNNFTCQESPTVTRPMTTI